ncbi:hypothetical protein DJICPGNB_10595 [Escherichia coli]|nr:hypothetical protein DJICPGNB_10595 [Escherichia coli]
MENSITESSLSLCFYAGQTTSRDFVLRIAGKRARAGYFGYWYCPDGRDAQTQSQFEDVEVKPQAFDWLFCVAAGYPFNVSCDNLEGDFEPDRGVSLTRKTVMIITMVFERPAMRWGSIELLSHAEPRLNSSRG